MAAPRTAPGDLPVYQAVLFWAIAVLSILSVYLINRGPLFYFDTGGYLLQGRGMLDMLGLAQAPATAAAPGDAAPAIAAQASSDNTVQGQRSAVYALAISLSDRLLSLHALALAQALTLIGSLWILARLITRECGITRPEARSIAALSIAACLGSASFYATYLMPDILAPVLIISLSLFVGFLDRLQRWEIILLVALSLAAIVTHPSHLAIALIFVPVSLVVVFLFRPAYGARAILMCVLIASAGVLERVAFKAAVETVSDAEVTYAPFISARLISDGPGKAYLDAYCPEIGLVHCKLNDMLVRPFQITPSHIIFEKTEELGSFALLPLEDQKAITAEQATLLRGVALTRPLHLSWTVIRNTFQQLGLRISVHQTIASEQIKGRLSDWLTVVPTAIAEPWLTRDPLWLRPLMFFQAAIYAASAVGVVLLLLSDRYPSYRNVRAFGACMLLGVLANAFVCGAISQPADRYGARVIFILPVLAAFLLLMLNERHPRKAGVA